MMRSLAFLSMCCSIGAMAQIQHGGHPIGWGTVLTHSEEIVAYQFPSLAAEEIPLPGSGLAAEGSKIGTQRLLDVDILAAGTWNELTDGRRVCRYVIHSPGAAMIAVQFDRFRLPEDALVFIYDEQRTRFIGGFDHRNEQASGAFATELVKGDAVVIEYQEPLDGGEADLHLAGITHAWAPLGMNDEQRDIYPGYPSSPCHINVACPIAADWQDQNRSVVMFMRPDGGTCNGTLVNDVAQDGTPYVLIAHHCYQPNADQWVFYFNYQSPGCVGDTGQTVQTLTGSVRRSGDYYKQFVLLELNDVPPAEYAAYYAGWDRSGATPQSGVAIHNPLSDVKKIAFSNTPFVTDYTDDVDSVLSWSNVWSDGLLESGGSGAPLFDQNKLVVGTLVEAEMTCATATTAPAYFSKFSNNWDGSASNMRLRDWLDPSNTAVMTVNGYDPNGSTPLVKVRLKAMLQGPYVQGVGLMSAGINNSGLLPLVEPYTASGYVHAGDGGGEATTQSVLNMSGAQRVVDWVVIELRDASDGSVVLASRSALLLRNGTIVDMDGTSAVSFQGMAPGPYHIGLRHRNHLGIMIAAPVGLTGQAVLLDLTNGTAPLLGAPNATVNIGGVQCLWSGDSNGDDTLRYTGEGNDRDPTLQTIGSPYPTVTVSGYYPTDINMDGMVKYTGANNDRDPLLLNIGSIPTGERNGTLP